MIRLPNRESCCGCGACSAVCVHAALEMKADAMGFPYPVVNSEACVDCGLCERVCAFHRPDDYVAPRAFAVRFPALLDGSQSGGLATAVMRKAVREGYVVYGAAMDADYVVRHRRVETLEDLEPLRLSKYVQSETTSILAPLVADFKAGRKVLFTGTPCQCAGMASLAGLYRGRLLTADIICHGVPSPAIWKDYLDYVQEREGEKLTGAFFRDPALGWHDSRETLLFGERRVVSRNYNFLYGHNLILRPSCAACPFASAAHPSDITMGDCWGVEKALPGFADDNRGCSLLLVQSPEGEAFVKEFSEDCQRAELELGAVMQENLQRPAKLHPRAKSLEKDYIRKGFPYVLRHHGIDSLANKWEGFLKKHFTGR